MPIRYSLFRHRPQALPARWISTPFSQDRHGRAQLSVLGAKTPNRSIPMKFNRVDYTQHLPGAFKGLAAAAAQVHGGSIGPELAELISLRVSQLNGCAFCLDMHASALRKAGVDPRKLDTLAGWHDSRYFDARERAVLAWTEALTRLADGAPPDALYEALQVHFDERGIAEVTMAVALINAWNRLGVGLQPELP